MELPKEILAEVTQYCKLNKVDDINDFIVKTFIQGFNIVKYGLFPSNNQTTTEVKITTESNDTPVIETSATTLPITNTKQKKITKKSGKSDIYGE
jgi:hypothetical protein